MSKLMKFGPPLPDVEIPESSLAPDWQQARPRAIARALERALERPHGNWYVAGESRRFGEKAQRLRIAGEDLVAWRVDGELLIAPDACPHMGASLADGDVEDGVVSCPWHAWRFCVKDGTWRDNPRIKIDHFDVRIEDDEGHLPVRTSMSSG